METTHDFPNDGAQLSSVVRGIRNRWRLKRALRGASIVVAAGFILLAASAFALDALRYGETAVTVVRVLALLALAGLAVVFVVLPLLPQRMPADRRVALYLEEHEPSLDAAVVTAVEVSEQHPTAGAPSAQAPAHSAVVRQPLSAALVSHLTRDALDRVHKVDDGRHVDERGLHVSAGALAAVIAVALLATLLGPAPLRHGMRLMLMPWDREQPLSLYAVSAEPGSVTVARGGDLLIAARLSGFQSDAVDLLVRQRDSTNWTRLTMALDSVGRYAGRYTFRLFDIAAPMEYVVESNGVRSPVYRIDVADVPYTKKLGLDYHFPAYTGLAPQAVDEGGDIAALKGTQVRVRVTTTVPARSGRLIVERGQHTDTVALAPLPDGTLAGAIRVESAGFYKVELEAQDGRIFPGSLDYTIDAIPDRPPTISFSKPGRDEKALNVDEVYTEVQAEDDYGVQKLELVYSVNGTPEKTVPLYGAGGKRTPQMSAGHTFMLEDFKLQPGDVVSYYARATDNDAVSGAKSATTDIYFLNIRPFDQNYRQDQSGGGGGGGGGDQPGQLSQQQREIIAGTFNTLRDRAAKQQKELQEDLSTLRVAQQKLHGQVEELARRIVDRGIAGRDSNFAKIAEILGKAAPVMDTAEKHLADADAQGALGPEQRALQQLQRAEAVFRDVRVSMGGGGGGGAGGRGPRAEDLADLFELNREKLRNQYESVQRGQQQAADQQVDEAAEKLKRLAARQQQENERAQRKADSLAGSQRMGASGSSGGASQRQLAQEAEEAARQLERLARERAEQQRQESQSQSSQSSQQSSSSNAAGGSQSSSSTRGGEQSAAAQRQQRALEDAARRLREAADAMRRSANGSESSQQTAAERNAALQRLEEAKRLLDRERSGRLERDVEDALRTARELGQQQQQVAGETSKLWEGADAANAQQRAERVQSLTQKKGQMADQVRDLKSRLDRMSLDARRENREASTGLADASKAMRDRKLEEKIRASQGSLRFAGPEYSRALEGTIGNDLADLQQRLEQVASAARNGKPADNATQSEALDRARQLVRGVASLDERMRQQRNQSAGEQSAQGQRGQQGQPGAQGQTGQQPSGQQASGQQGQQGQRGQQGQPGGQQAGGSPQGGPRGGVNGGGPPGQTSSTGQPAGQTLGQFGREMRERLSDAQALRRDLNRQGIDTRELDRAIAGLQSLSNDRILADERTALDLRAQTLDELKSFEFALRKKLGASDDERVLLGRSGDVPAAFKQYVEQYYRSLAGSKPK